MTARSAGWSLVLANQSVRETGFEARVQAAAAGGFAGIGLRPEQRLREHDRGVSDADMRAMLAAHGVAVVELEALYDWAVPPEQRDPSRPRVDDFIATAIALGAHHVNLVGDAPQLHEGLQGAALDDACESAAAQLAPLARRLADCGVRAAIEPHSRLSLRSPRVAWEIARRSGVVGCGVLPDTWHMFRTGTTGELASLPAEAIVALQVVDGWRDIVESPAGDKEHRCLPPGEGDFAIAATLRAITERGLTPPLSVEVTSDELGAMTPEQRARHLGDATRAMLDGIGMEVVG